METEGFVKTIWLGFNVSEELNAERQWRRERRPLGLPHRRAVSEELNAERQWRQDGVHV